MAPEGIRDILGRIGRKIEKAESAMVIASAGLALFCAPDRGIGFAQCDRAFAQRNPAGGQSAFARSH